MRVRSQQESLFIADFLGKWSRYWLEDIVKITDDITTGVYNSIECHRIYRVAAVDGMVHAQLLPDGKKYIWPLETQEVPE